MISAYSNSRVSPFLRVKKIKVLYPEKIFGEYLLIIGCLFSYDSRLEKYRHEYFLVRRIIYHCFVLKLNTPRLINKGFNIVD